MKKGQPWKDWEGACWAEVGKSWSLQQPGVSGPHDIRERSRWQETTEGLEQAGVISSVVLVRAMLPLASGPGALVQECFKVPT